MSTVLLHLERWQSIAPNQRDAVLALQISDEQVEYAGTVERAVAACESSSPEDVAGLAILAQSEVVGFLVLSRRAKRPDWAPASSVALTAMRVDVRAQGQGIGKAALGLVDSWLLTNWQDEKTLALCVDEENLSGRRAYAAAGFTEYDEPRMGRIGVVRYMSKSLGAAPSGRRVRD